MKVFELESCFIKKQQIHSFQESEKQEELKTKFKQLANQDAKEGKKPHFVNKSNCL